MGRLHETLTAGLVKNEMRPEEQGPSALVLRRRPQRILAWMLLSWCVGCGSPQQAKSPTGSSADAELSSPITKAAAPTREAAPAEDVVQRAERPFSGYRLSDGKTYPAEDLLTTLADADAVCVGERHAEALDHYAELRTLTGLLERRQMRGFELGLALEMVRYEYQRALSAYESQELDQQELEMRVDWEEEWGFPAQFYRPQLLTARARGARLLALGVRRSVTRRIAERGLEGFDDYQRSRLPELDFSVERHRHVFDELMAGHPSAEGDALERYYQAQVVWDEAMAETSARWLMERSPGRKLLILAGTAHCHRDAIPSRIERRTGMRVVSLLPVQGGRPVVRGDSGTVDALIAQGYEFQMVFEP